MEKLRKIEEKKLDEIINKAENCLPHSLSVYNLLKVGFKGELINRAICTAYVPESEDIPCFIVITGIARKPKDRNSLTAFWNPEEIHNDVAKGLLKSLPNWNWELPIFFKSMSVKTLKAFEQIMLGEEGLCNSKLQLTYKNEGFSYVFERFKYSYTLPDDVFLGPLSTEDAPFVYANWIYNFSNKMEVIFEDLKCMPSIAAYSKTKFKDYVKEINSSNDNKISNCPVSWAVGKVSGEIGYTHTLPEFRNKGLSKAVTYELALKVLEMNINPFVNICGENQGAIRAHEKIGFKKYCPVGYHLYLRDGMQCQDY